MKINTYTCLYLYLAFAWERAGGDALIYVCLYLYLAFVCVVSEDDFEPEKDPKREKKENFGSKQINMCTPERETFTYDARAVNDDDDDDDDDVLYHIN